MWSIDLERPGAKIRKLMERDLMNMTNSYPRGQLETMAEYFLFSCLHCIFCFSYLSDKPAFSFRSVGKENTFGKDTTISVPFYSQGFFCTYFQICRPCCAIPCLPNCHSNPEDPSRTCYRSRQRPRLPNTLPNTESQNTVVLKLF